jgi:hypothetical protein
MFLLLKVVSENRLCELISLNRSFDRENVESWSYEKKAMKSAIHCQSMARQQSAAIESKNNHSNFGAPQSPEQYAYACNHHSSARCEMTSHYAFTPL